MAKPFPKGKYRIVYADPPWPYGRPFKTYGKLPYKTLSLKELMEFKDCEARPVTDLFDKDSVLFLWVPPALLDDHGLPLLKAWGFTYKQQIIWIKRSVAGNLGCWINCKHEILLIGKKGGMLRPKVKFKSYFMWDIPKIHSYKPEAVYKKIELMYPNESYLELFARKWWPGWTAWGNDLEEEPMDGRLQSVIFGEYE